MEHKSSIIHVNYFLKLFQQNLILLLPKKNNKKKIKKKNSFLKRK
jgi:hypothetical protein